MFLKVVFSTFVQITHTYPFSHCAFEEGAGDLTPLGLSFLIYKTVRGLDPPPLGVL